MLANPKSMISLRLTPRLHKALLYKALLHKALLHKALLHKAVAYWLSIASLIYLPCMAQAQDPSASNAQLEPSTLPQVPPDVAQDPPQVDFVRDIQPILQSRCYACHSASKQEGDYRLDLRHLALGTASSGEHPIVPGDVAKSTLLQQIQGDSPSMPAEGEPLTEAEQHLMERWIAQGANWPDEVAGDDSSIATLWSLQPLATVSLGTEAREASGSAEVLSPIDVHVLHRLQQVGLGLSPRASRSDLIRRLYLDLLGLPPTPEQARSFVTDERPDAYERVVDSLLANPRFGERWGRHWLDVVRFAETTGFETNVDRPNAYPYRDWVIEAINADLPYDQFAAAQIAGDQLGQDAATGFLVAGAWDQVKSPDINLTWMQREDELADMVGTTATTFLGLTLGCARCHTHKFDPLSQSDYYALKAILVGTQHGERRLQTPQLQALAAETQTIQQELARIDQAVLQTEPYASLREASLPNDQASPKPVRAPVNPRQNTDRFQAKRAKYLRFTILETNQSEPCIDELEVWSVDEQGNLLENVALQQRGAVLRSSGNFADASKHRLELANDGHYGNDSSWISNQLGQGWLEIELPQETFIGCVRWGRDRNAVYQDRLATAYAISLGCSPTAMEVVATNQDRASASIPPDESTSPELRAREGLLQSQRLLEQRLLEQRRRVESAGMVYAGNFVAAPAVHRLYRGEPQSPRELVAPDVPKVMGSLWLESETPEHLRRLALARWLGRADNHLVARVIVNRIWQHHFGRGIVATPNDFGSHGATPSHPELLDWLAQQLIDHQWSMKHLHRMILLSQVYQQSSQPRPEGMERDSESRLLWRYPPRRLEAEAIRDSILAVSGSLDLAMGGPGYSSFEPNSNYVRVYLPKKEFGASDFRRMVYMTRVRMVPDPTFGAFDSPDGGLTCPVRSRSTTPIQALQLLNSPFVMDQAHRFGRRLELECNHQPDLMIERAFVLAIGRLPTDAENRSSRALIDGFGVQALTRALLNANEFLWLP